jgi:hypothetical protein
MNEKNVWERNEFPVAAWSPRLMIGAKFSRPRCFTPKEEFYWGRHFTAGEPCIAFESDSFGWVIQRQESGIVIGRF